MKRLLPISLLLGTSLSQVTVTSYISAGSTPTTNSGATHTVSVGYGGHTFVPDITLANVGDTIEFDFYPLNHSVVRSEYKVPCVPYEMTGPKVGFFSGFHLVEAILAQPPKWSVVVNDTNPIFYYCSAPGSCINHRMVGVINPNASVSLQTQKEYAGNSSFVLQPGDPWPPEASSSMLPTATATVVSTAPSPPTSAPAQTTSAAPTASHHSSLSSGAIAGIAIGGAAILLIAGFIIWWCGRQSRRNQRHTDAPPTYAPPQFTAYAPMPSSAKYQSEIATNQVYPTYSYAEQSGMGPFGPLIPQQHQQAHFFTPQPSPGHAQQTSPLMGPAAQPHLAEADFMRGSSPSPPLGGQGGGGLAAFLERSANGRLSPSTEGQHESVNNNSVVGGFPVGSGPYEMSAGGNAARN